jgi:ABC-type amino acid transport substrate-binding protein
MEEEDYLSTKKVITMCVDPDWEPFEILDKNGKHVGIAADIIKLITSKLGIEIKIIPTKTWEESIEFSKAKKCDILSFLNQTPQRESWLTFTEPIFQDPNVIIGRVDNDAIDDLSKIKASIAIPKGTAMYERFEKDFPNLIIIPVNSENEAFEFVEQKKADLTVRSMIISAYTIKEKGLFNLKIINQPKNYENYLKMGIIKEEPILRDILKYEDEKKYFDSLIDYNFSIFFDNLRDVNRYLNIFKFKLNALEHKVNATDLAVLTAFELFEKDAFFWIKNNKDRLYAYNKDFKDAIELFKNKDKE